MRQREARYRLLNLLLLPHFIKAPGPPPSTQSVPARCPEALSLSLQHPPSSPLVPLNVKSCLLHHHGFHPKTRVKLVRSPLHRHSLFASSLVALLYLPGWSTSPTSPLALQTLSAYSPSSRLPRKSLQLPEHLQHCMTWPLVLREHHNLFTIHLSIRSSRPRHTTPLYGLAQTLIVLFWSPEARTFSSAVTAPLCD